jgi:hypothetical protein
MAERVLPEVREWQVWPNIEYQSTALLKTVGRPLRSLNL